MAPPDDPAPARRPLELDPPAWLTELPLTPGPPWVTMGVRGLSDASWLVIDDDYEAQLREKATADEALVFQALPATREAGHEVARLVEDWLAAYAPAAEPDRLAAARSPSKGRHPLLSAALTVQEDLCLMAEHDGAYCLVAAAVHFPSHWRLADKMGLPMARIHEPVRHYADELEHRADRFFARLGADRIVVRRNVSIHDHADLFRPEPPETYEDFDGAFGALWLRSERQTLRRLPTSGAVLFTIKTQQCALPVVRQVPEVASGLAAKLRAIRTDHEADGVPVHAPAGLPEWLEAGSAASR